MKSTREQPIPRKTRYQGAIIRDQHILLVQHHNYSDDRRYWILPGGGQDPGESDEDTVRREMSEETGLNVSVDRLLFENTWNGEGVYRYYRVYLCTPLSGQVSPGYEPEPEAASIYEISAVRWIDLLDEQFWGQEIKTDSITAPVLRQIRDVLFGENIV